MARGARPLSRVWRGSGAGLARVWRGSGAGLAQVCPGGPEAPFPPSRRPEDGRPPRRAQSAIAGEHPCGYCGPVEASPELHYTRVVIKLSGEALCGKEGGSGIDTATLKATAVELAEVQKTGIQLGVVVGGGNIFRGLKGASEGMDRAQSDFMGMLATVINSLALQDALERVGCPTRVMTALEIKDVAEPYIRRRAIRHLNRGHVVIFAAGTGNPYFSTDTAAALRAMEIRAEALLKATKVEGIYDRDPRRHEGAKMFERVSYDRFLSEHLAVMDSTAVTLCRENGLPIRVFKMTPGNIKRVCLGEHVGTTVTT